MKLRQGHHQWAAPGEPVEEGQQGQPHLLPRSTRVDVGQRTLVAHEEGERSRHAFGLAPADLEAGDVGDGGPALGERLFGRIGGLDGARLAHHLRHRPPDVGFPVRHATAFQHRGAVLVHRPVRELAGQPALAHSGVSEQDDQLRPVPKDRGAHRVPEKTELFAAADERAVHPSRPTSGRSETGSLVTVTLPRTFPGDPPFDRDVPTAGLQAARRLVAHHAGRAGSRGRADQDLTRVGHGLQPAGHVDHVTHRRVVTAGPKGADQHLTGVDPDAQADRLQLARERHDALLHLQRRPHRPLSVVLVGDRCAEQGDDGVTDDLVHPPPEGRDVGRQTLEAAVDEVLDLLWVHGLAQRGEADEVGEHHGDDPALVTSCAHRHDGLPASGAEAGPLRQRVPAGWARHRQPG